MRSAGVRTVRAEGHRPDADHRARDLQPPDRDSDIGAAPVTSPATARIRRHRVLGGLIHEYEQAAWGFHVPHARAATGVGAPSTPRPAVFTRPARTVRPPLAVPPRPGPAPRCPSHLPGLWVTRHQRGFTHVRPSGLPLACAPGWNGSASASSLSFAPRGYPRRASGRGLALNTGQELRHRHHRRSSNPRAHSQHATSCRTSSAQSSPTNSRISPPDPNTETSQRPAGEPSAT